MRRSIIPSKYDTILVALWCLEINKYDREKKKRYEWIVQFTTPEKNTPRVGYMLHIHHYRCAIRCSVISTASIAFNSSKDIKNGPIRKLAVQAVVAARNGPSKEYYLFLYPHIYPQRHVGESAEKKNWTKGDRQLSSLSRDWLMADGNVLNLHWT